MTLVTDTGPLWSFAIVGHLDLLGRRLQGRVQWTNAVREEIRLNLSKEPELASVLEQGWLPEPVNLFNLGTHYVTEAFRIRSSMAAPNDHPRAHLGEAESIVLARYLNASVVTEDWGAAQRAGFEGLIVRRTTDLLAECVAMDEISESEAWKLYQRLAKAKRLPEGLSRTSLFR